MRLLFLSIAFSALLLGDSCTKEFEGLKLKGSCKGELKHGEFISYYENGLPSWVINFSYDKLDGDFISFNPNGKVKFQGSYKDDLLWGKFTYFKEDETIKAKFKRGVLNGWLYKYDSNNKKVQAIKYYYGKMVKQIYF